MKNPNRQTSFSLFFYLLATSNPSANPVDSTSNMYPRSTQICPVFSTSKCTLENHKLLPAKFQNWSISFYSCVCFLFSRVAMRIFKRKLDSIIPLPKTLQWLPTAFGKPRLLNNGPPCRRWWGPRLPLWLYLSPLFFCWLIPVMLAFFLLFECDKFTQDLMCLLFLHMNLCPVISHGCLVLSFRPDHPI